ncbi:G3E family GTPase [Fontibacillus phaseoli]|uniref:G3E family GTPase n=1 Tax=Fontibacillus phaseoli TaxID=1416533 RepID=A0A369B6N0_9BACL|nr:GTP-binding protein [Fontibacillus phaseoli]RCX17091.1 G3E family GTPase [Fontibacillus phaseoli]
MEVEHGTTPIYILSGFLGSGKTTLLQHLLSYWKDLGLRPAVIMNELGEINLDGQLIREEVPMAEMLGGCICCTIRGDLSVQLYELVKQERPDVVVIEATGAANPMEIFDAVTESSLYMKLDIRPMITVVDAAHLAELYASQQGKTYRLMLEQIRCGSDLILNKIDRISPETQQEMKELLGKLNPYARVIPAVKCEVDLPYLLEKRQHQEDQFPPESPKHVHEQKLDPVHEHHEEAEHYHATDSLATHSHASHDHVTVYTHYFSGPVNSVVFEQFIKDLPREIYRGKGILRFSDTSSRFLFQYAYREADYLKITPQGDVPDVAVFIGEHFDQTALAGRLKDMEEKPE